MIVTTMIRDTFLARSANSETELPLYRAFMKASLATPQVRVERPIEDTPRGLLHDLLLVVWARAEALGLPLDRLGDPSTLAS